MAPGRPEGSADWLLTSEAIRARCGAIMDLAERDQLIHFTLDLDRLAWTADYVTAVILDNYPDLSVPYHSRWRHFSLAGKDFWRDLEKSIEAKTTAKERGRIRFDLAVTSVLLDAGAGPLWKFQDPSGLTFSRSEGLALASFRAFERGLFSSHAEEPLRADATALRAVSTEALANAFQVSSDNPLEGLEGRAALLRRLGEVIEEEPELFGEGEARVGRLFDCLVAQAEQGRLPAHSVLDHVLFGLGTIWPGREVFQGTPLGDCWRYPNLGGGEEGKNLVPFHKLSQWLTYSLFEPLEVEGELVITEISALTGLAEYRNGGLFLDAGVLRLKDQSDAQRAHAPDEPIIIEWRALTLVLLDRLAPLVRVRLDKSEEDFPLAKMLEGGTWAAGRRLAGEMRSSGGPPLTLISDGAVF